MLICLTGQSGVGKTTALKYLNSLGANTFEMDKYIHQIYQRGMIGYKLILKHFGKEYVDSKKVDRKKLGRLVFTNKKMLMKLNKIMFPIMQKKLVELQQNRTNTIVEFALFLEHNLIFKKYFKYVILIRAKKSLKNNNFLKKFSYVINFPTLDVGNIKNPIKNSKIKTNFIVDNFSDLKVFKKELKKIFLFLNL
ncbi:MAG: dephospho-CoA kinase [Mycoplasmataceae bacterium]|jgi:dephospho-CoA kinase|nr:dephospho-CoA kinase [Mycoplasmataceae bacterium]